MRIKKTSQTTPVQAEVVNAYSESESNAYSCDYINNSDSYSTSEVKTNKTFFGKPVYRKCFEILKADTSSSSINVNHNISNLGDIVELKGTLYRPNGISDNIPNAMPNTDWNVYFSDTDTTIIRIRMGGTIYNDMSSIKIIIEYTKTTD